MDVAGKNCIQACCNNTVIGQVQSEKSSSAGNVAIIDFNFFFLYKSTNICQFRRSCLHIMLVFLSFLSKLLCVHVYFFWGQSMEGK